MKRLGLWPYFAILGLIVVVSGLMLWSDMSFWLSDEQRSDLAGGLMGGALLGVAVLGAEVALGRQLDRLEEQRRRSAERGGCDCSLAWGLTFVVSTWLEGISQPFTCTIATSRMLTSRGRTSERRC